MKINQAGSFHRLEQDATRVLSHTVRWKPKGLKKFC